jgi:hypothetical protein
VSAMTASLRIATRRPLAARLPRGGAVLRRQCACGQHSPGGGECQSCADQRQKAARMPLGPGGEGLAPPIVHDALHSSGHALDQGTRQFLEPRFGRDFSGVRIHAGERAAEAARAVNARAFTVGQSIVLGQGHSLASPSGLQLVAHELAHTLQQERATTPSPGEPIEVGRGDHPTEHEAEEFSQAALSGEFSTAARTATADNAMQLRRDDTEKPAPPPLIPAPKPLRPLVEGIDPKIVGTPLGDFSLEDVHRGLDALRGAGQGSSGGGSGNCVAGTTAGRGEFAGQCCRSSIQSATSCCPPIRMNMLGVCCGPNEVPRDTQCVKMEQPPQLQPPPMPKPPPLPRPPLQDFPERVLPPGQAYA